MYRRILFKSVLVQLLLISVSIAQDYQDYESAAPRAAPVRIRPGANVVDTRPTPVPILKQINRHNEDGSYTYGYEGADGSFKIETKLATGEVKGKYGYVDETGKVRVVEYGANKYGFQPSGEGITVAPPTLVDETTNKDRVVQEYEEEPQKPYIARVSRPQARPAPELRPISRPEPQYVDYEQEPEPAPRPAPQYSHAPSPPRLQIPGAHPLPQQDDVVYSQQQRPARPNPEYSQHQTFSLSQPQVRVTRPIFSPSEPARAGPPIRPVAEPQPSYAPRPVQQPVSYAAPSPNQQRSVGVLDQLAKDYALPQGGAQPLHDISFGYY